MDEKKSADLATLRAVSHTYRCENSPGCSCCACERDKLRAENEALREVERLVRECNCCDGDDARTTDETHAALARLDALRKEKA